MRRASSFLVICALLLVGTSAAAAAELPAQAGTPVRTAATPVLAISGRLTFGTDLALDADGHRHVVATSGRGDLWYATDRTGIWMSMRVLLGDTDGGLAWTRPSVAVDEQGRVHVAVVSECTDCAPSAMHGIWYVTDKGRARGTFGAPRRVAGDMMTDPSLRVIGGVRYLAYHRCLCGPGDTEAPLFFKTDRGGRWTKEKVTDYGVSPSLRVTADGQARIAYAGRHGLRYAAAKTRRGAFPAPARIPGTGGGDSPSLALGSRGQPQVAWVRYDRRSQVLYSRSTSAGWVTPRVLGPGRTVELSIDAAGRPHLISGTSQRVVHRLLRGGVWERHVIADGIRPDSVDIRAFGRRASIAWTQEDMPRGVWVTRD
jgi:hypothetical protein